MKRGLLGPEFFVTKQNTPCSTAHKKNPNFPTQGQPDAIFHSLRKQEMYNVNPKRINTELLTPTTPLYRKLRAHFAENACSFALKKVMAEDRELMSALQRFEDAEKEEEKAQERAKAHAK